VASVADGFRRSPSGLSSVSIFPAKNAYVVTSQRNLQKCSTTPSVTLYRVCIQTALRRYHARLPCSSANDYENSGMTSASVKTF